MGYLHINNLYKDQTILLFRDCYALEKIHGSSAHIAFNGQDGSIRYFAGGESHSRFVSIFKEDELIAAFKNLGHPDKIVTIYGEVYGGKCQGMSATYGVELKFIAFDVQIGECWLNVIDADNVVRSLGLDFVYYTRISTELDALNAARDADSQQAIRNGVGPGKKMEGVVLRPVQEMTLNNGSRVISKHKRDEFKETATPRPVVDPSKLVVLEAAAAIANEWVTGTRLQHVLDKIPGHDITQMGRIMAAMKEDVYREGAGEVVQSKEADKAIGAKTAELYKAYLKAQLQQIAA